MKSFISKIKVLSLIAPFLIFLGLSGVGGCGGATGEISLSLGASSTEGSMSSTAGLTTSSTTESQEVEAVFVTIERVEVHVSGGIDEAEGEGDEDGEEDIDEEGDVDEEDGEEDDDEGGWITVATPMKTFNLLDLRNCLLEKLGSAALPAGEHVTQIRLILGETSHEGHLFANFVVINGEEFEIKVPSGFQTGIKINPQGPVEIEENGEVHVTLLIDLSKSLVFTGSGKILFKPVVKATVGGETADAFVTGKVTNAEDGSPLVGAGVSAEIPNADATEEAKVENSTTTDEEGNYRLCVAPGTYDLVASMEGFEESVEQVSVEAGETITQDFALTATPPSALQVK